MILCHKCSGVLADCGDDTTGLASCSCISGYVRGFEQNVSRQQAIVNQIDRAIRDKELFTRQRRDNSWIVSCDEEIALLSGLK